MKGLFGFLRKNKKGVNELEQLTLNRYGQMYHELEEKIRQDLMARTHEELIRIRNATGKVRSGNCWYAIYRIKESLRESVRDVLRAKGF